MGRMPEAGSAREEDSIMGPPPSRRLVVCFALAVAASAGGVVVGAQYATPPDVYSITQTNSMFVKNERIQVWRDGSKAVIELTVPAGVGVPKATHVRTLYDLQAHVEFDWDAVDSSVPCIRGTFSGDWGDPFAQSAEMTADLLKQATKVGTETVSGMAATVMTTGTGADAMKAWIDTKYGLLVRLEDSKHATVVEVTELTIAKPAASVFALPAACAAVASKPLPETAAQRIAAETGGSADGYANAIYPPASSPDSCGVDVKIVHAGTLEPITSGFRAGLDLDQSSKGGSLGVGTNKDVTSQFRNGVLALDGVPPHFTMDIEFGEGGAAFALIYRQCFLPRTVLMLVVKNPAKLSDGADWLWVKSGK
jgi:hypothetical protein